MWRRTIVQVTWNIEFPTAPTTSTGAMVIADSGDYSIVFISIERCSIGKNFDFGHAADTFSSVLNSGIEIEKILFVTRWTSKLIIVRCKPIQSCNFITSGGEGMDCSKCHMRVCDR